MAAAKLFQKMILILSQLGYASKECWWSFFFCGKSRFCLDSSGWWQISWLGGQTNIYLPSRCYFHRHYGIEMLTWILQGCDISFQIIYIYSPTNTAHCLGLKFDTQTEDFLQQSHAAESSDEVVALHTEASPLLATSPYHAFASAPPCFLSSKGCRKIFQILPDSGGRFAGEGKPFQKSQKPEKLSGT